jgi:hypothetical protein
MNNNSLIGKCIAVFGKHNRGVYKVEGSEDDITYRRWSVSGKRWETTSHKLSLDIDSIRPLNKCPDESKGGFRKRNTRRKKRGSNV